MRAYGYKNDLPTVQIIGLPRSGTTWLGDLIIAVGGQKVVTSRQANRIIYGSRIGETLTFHILRQGRQRTIDVVLAERPDEI